MKRNVGHVDKIVRYVLAALLAVAGILLFNSVLWLALIALVLAVVLVATSLMSFCPLYRLFGLTTCKVEAPKEEA